MHICFIHGYPGMYVHLHVLIDNRVKSIVQSCVIHSIISAILWWISRLFSLMLSERKAIYPLWNGQSKCTIMHFLVLLNIYFLFSHSLLIRLVWTLSPMTLSAILFYAFRKKAYVLVSGIPVFLERKQNPCTWKNIYVY